MYVGKFFLQNTYFIKTWRYDRDSISYLHNKENIKETVQQTMEKRKMYSKQTSYTLKTFVEEFILLKI